MALTIDTIFRGNHTGRLYRFASAHSFEFGEYYELETLTAPRIKLKVAKQALPYGDADVLYRVVSKKTPKDDLMFVSRTGKPHEMSKDVLIYMVQFLREELDRKGRPALPRREPSLCDSMTDEQKRAWWKDLHEIPYKDKIKMVQAIRTVTGMAVADAIQTMRYFMTLHRESLGAAMNLPRDHKLNYDQLVQLMGPDPVSPAVVSQHSLS